MKLRIKPSIVIAAILAVGATGWILSGQVDGQTPPAEAATDATNAADAANDAKGEARDPVGVRVIDSTAQQHRAMLRITGRTAADRRATIRAEAEGRVTALPVEATERITEGAEIARVATDDRYARLKEAEALVAQRRIEGKAAEKLAKKGFQSETKRAEAEAALSAAKAQLERIRIELGKTITKAPFEAIIETKEVEIGDYVKVGDPLVTLVDLDPIIVEIQVSEGEIRAVKEGNIADIDLIGGDTVSGFVARIAPAANPNTRTFSVEIEIPNTDGFIREGLTTTVRLPLRDTRAHLLSPAVLTLDKDGRVGVKAVGTDSRVTFHPVEIIEDTATGMWVAGLPETLRVIAVGQEYVKPGTLVEASPLKVGALKATETDGKGE